MLTIWWALKNWCFWTVVLEKTLESPWDCKEIQPVHPKGNQSWIFIGKTDAKAEAPILWPPDMKNWFIRKHPDAGKDWKQKEKGMTEWDGWMASLTQCTWVWASSRRWWRTEKPGVLQPMESQKVRHDWGTEQQQLAINRSELLIHAAAWMNLENTLLSERRQSQKAMYYMILFLWKSRKEKTVETESRLVVV